MSVLILSCSSDSERSAPTANGDGTGGSLAIFALKGNYLYSVDNQKLNVFSLIDTEHPSKVNEIIVGFNIETLFADDEFLYIGSQNGMFIYSVQNPENPVQLASVEHFTACDPVVANDTHAFVTLHSTSTCGSNLNVLEVYDIANPQYPQLIHQRNLTHPKGLGLYNNFLVVCDDDIKIFDVQNPAEPVLVKSVNKMCYDVIITGDTLFAIGETGVYRYLLDPNDITNVVPQSEVIF
jgi:hypothetical protein